MAIFKSYAANQLFELRVIRGSLYLDPVTFFYVRLGLAYFGLQPAIIRQAEQAFAVEIQAPGWIYVARLEELVRGVRLKDGHTKAVSATHIDPPDTIWAREPPLRVRANIPDSWVEVTLSQGRNRQVRRMTAAVGLPTLRLIRYSIGPWTLDNLAPGETREISNADAWKLLL